MAGSLSGPMAQTTVLNDYNVDPNTAAVRGHTSMQLDVPREAHPLNDAILAAATGLSDRPLGRRRVIYVISNGNEYGSKAKTSRGDQVPAAEQRSKSTERWWVTLRSRCWAFWTASICR